MTRVFTTGQVARIFSVNINTAIKWFDEGKLKGFRLPRSNERRIYRESVVEFMEDHDISIELLRVYDTEESNKKRSRGRSAAPEPVSPPGHSETRTFPRKPVDLPGRVFIDEDPQAEVMVRNLSMGGAYITGYGETLIPGAFRLRLVVENGRVLELGCQLVHLRRSKDETMALGCRFTQVDPGSLQRYLAEI